MSRNDENVEGKEESPSIFGADSGQIDRLLAWPMSGNAEPAPAAGLEQFAEGPGGQIGRYKLLRLLGEGGMGVIYLAEQQEPVRREVALKILKPGMDSKRVLARFETEQQTLALMEHPYIARVYDAGLAPSGRPYFVMEHVQGLPVTAHCDERRLTIEQRLHLFLHICGAVQHAHQKGIIHRDLKPSNILVVTQDQEMAPKVIDFGIARAISQPLTERTFYTEQGQPIGTPEYMSPEQADPANQDIDTRTDVYALGVVLYELLAGVLPFDPQTFRTGGIDHIRKVICEEDPKTPSTRLSRTSVEEATESARRRRTDIRTLQRKLRGDLDWITLKAMEKDRSRRYATVDALATDIRRYLDHQPVSAAPPGTLYRAGKFARRHRQALAVTGTAIVLLLVLLWAARAHVQAGRERIHAETLEHERILAKAQDLFDSRGMQAQDVSDPSNEALALLQPLLASRHVGPQAQLLCAGILVEHRYYDEAVPRLEGLLQERPEIAGAAHALLARAIWESPSLGPPELKKVEEHRQKAEALLPETAEAYYLRAMTAFTIPEKLDLLAKALDLDANHYESLRLRALTYYASRKYARLKEDALLMMHLRRRDPLGYALRAAALRELGDHEEAIQCYDRAITLTAQDDPQHVELHAGRCETLMRMGRYEHVFDDTEQYLRNAPDATVLRFHAFCALIALGRYEQASSLWRTYGSNLVARMRLKHWSTKYVFDTLEAGGAWHPPDRVPAGAAFSPMRDAEEMYRSLSTKAHRLITGGSCPRWSPDGTKVAFSLVLRGRGGVATYDLVTKETKLLVIPGGDPSWSPDGRYIAFVLDPGVSRLSEFATTEGKRGTPERALLKEVWVMTPDGAQPRRLARGAGWPSWSRDSKCVYYHSQVDDMIYRIALDDPEAQPVPICACSSDLAAVSPDGNCVAYINDESTASLKGVALRITDMSTQSCLAEWVAPLATWGGNWSPDGREFCFGGIIDSVDERTGLWVYDVAQKEAAKVLSGPIIGASWSRDRTRLAIRVGPLPEEIWVADLQPGLSTAEAMAPTQTLEQHCLESIAVCSRTLEVGPNWYVNHWARTASALWIGHDQASVYLQEFERFIDQWRVGPGVYELFYLDAQRILAVAALRERLLPLALMLAGKTVKQPTYARDLVHILHDLGQQEQAARLWQRVQEPMLKGGCRYDKGSDTYTMVGSGGDIWGTIDDFHFAYKKLAGDGSVTARIDGIENVHEWTKVGLMVRRTVAPDSANVMLLATPSGKLAFQYRRAENETSYSAYTPSNTHQLSHWLRLVRRGNRFTALQSSDGVTWEDVLFGSDQQVTFEIPMDETVSIGLAVTSHDVTRTAEARISHVTTAGDVSPSGPFTESQDIRFQLPSSPNAPAGGK